MYHGNYEARVQGDELDNFKWVKTATDGRAFFREKKELQKFNLYVHDILERDIDGVERVVLHQNSGWKEIVDGQLGYVVDKGIVGSNSRNVRADTDLHFQINEEMSAFESFEEFWKMQKICKTKEIAQYLMTIACKSMISTLFEKAAFPDKSVTVIVGTTNTLKTSTALAFSKIFNAKEQHSPEVTFTSAQAGIETYVSKYRDAILLIDDFMPGGDRSKQAELNGKLELLCRLYGDRASKKRMTTFLGKDVEYPVRGHCMITGEHLTGVESSRTRMVCLVFEQGEVDKVALNYYQNSPLTLPTYLFHYISFISQHVPEIIEYIRSKVPEYRNQMKFKVARYNETAAQLLTAVDIMFSYWKESGFLNNAEAEKHIWQSNILKIISKNDKALEKVDAVNVILQALLERVQNKTSSVKDVEKISSSDDGDIYFDEQFVYIPLNQLFHLTKDFCKSYDIPFYLQPKMIADKLKERGFLDCVENSRGHMECARKLKQSRGITKRFLYIKRDKLEGFFGDDM